LRPSDLEPIHGGLAERWWHKPVGDITPPCCFPSSGARADG
jgi:hypothetical protein